MKAEEAQNHIRKIESETPYMFFLHGVQVLLKAARLDTSLDLLVRQYVLFGTQRFLPRDGYSIKVDKKAGTVAMIFSVYPTNAEIDEAVKQAKQDMKRLSLPPYNLRRFKRGRRRLKLDRDLEIMDKTASKGKAKYRSDREMTAYIAEFMDEQEDIESLKNLDEKAQAKALAKARERLAQLQYELFGDIKLQ